MIITIDQAKEARGATQPFMFIGRIDENIMTVLTEMASTAELAGAHISGIGALKEIELGYYDLHHKTYDRKTFADDYELLSFTGNITLKDGEYYPHIHVALGGPDYQVIGGHLFSATVAVTAELVITPLAKLPTRKFDEQTGLSLICPLASA